MTSHDLILNIITEGQARDLAIENSLLKMWGKGNHSKYFKIHPDIIIISYSEVYISLRTQFQLTEHEIVGILKRFLSRELNREVTGYGVANIIDQ